MSDLSQTSQSSPFAWRLFAHLKVFFGLWILHLNQKDGFCSAHILTIPKCAIFTSHQSREYLYEVYWGYSIDVSNWITIEHQLMVVHTTTGYSFARARRREFESRQGQFFFSKIYIEIYTLGSSVLAAERRGRIFLGSLLASVYFLS